MVLHETTADGLKKSTDEFEHAGIDEEEGGGGDDDENNWFMSGFGFDNDETSANDHPPRENNNDDDDEDDNENWNDLPYPADANLTLSDLPSIMKRIGRPNDDQSVVEDYRERSRYILSTMGSLALVRGAQGDVLREAGAMTALLSTVMELWERLPPVNQHALQQTSQTTDPTNYANVSTVDPLVATLELAKNAWGAIRDLSCGNAENRRLPRVLEVSPGRNGIQLAAEYLRRYHEVPWPTISLPDIGLITAVVGVMRNITYATGDNSRQLHVNGVTDLLLWRLLHGNGPTTPTITTTPTSSTSSLPQTDLPWRGACFRAAGALVNMAEKCHECAIQCANHAALIHILAESWGRFDEKKKSFYLHPGLASIIEAAKDRLPPHEFDPTWHVMLEKEQIRKRIAQQVEEERKRRLVAAGLSPF